MTAASGQPEQFRQTVQKELTGGGTVTPDKINLPPGKRSPSTKRRHNRWHEAEGKCNQGAGSNDVTPVS